MKKDSFLKSSIWYVEGGNLPSYWTCRRAGGSNPYTYFDVQHDYDSSSDTYYGTTWRGAIKHRPLLAAGLKDFWRKIDGMPPTYHNPARHVTLDVPPEGWDPDGPMDQVLPDYVEPADKEEL